MIDNKNTVHEDLQPLRDALDVRNEEKGKLNLETGKVLNETDALIIAKVSEDIQIAMNNFKEDLLPDYLETLENTPNAQKIQEKEMWEISIEVGKALGLSPEEVMTRMGFKEVTSKEEFLALDVDGVNEDAVSQEEIDQTVYDNTVEGNPSLSKDVLSVFHQYSVDSTFNKIGTQKELVDFLRVKRDAAVDALDIYYTQKKNPTARPKAYATEEKKGGMEIINSIGKKTYPAVVQEWFNATNRVGLSAPKPEEWLTPSTGELNRAVMEEELNIRIAELTDGLTDGDIVNYKAALVAPDAKTKEGQIKIADYLETVPENYRNTDFESRYEAYVEGNSEKGKSSKSFNEWVEESPKIGGIRDWLKKLIFTIPFLKDLIGGTEFGEALGLDTSTEAEDNDEEFKKDNKGYTSYRAYLRAKEAEEMVSNADIEAFDWENVKISGIEVAAGKPDLSSMTPDSLVELKKVLESENCKYAKTKNLTLEELVWIDANITTKEENSFTITNGDETNSFDYTTEGVAAAKECVKEVDIESQIGEEYVDCFAEGVVLPDKAFTDTENKEFATLQPALQCLLKLPEELWGTFQISVPRLQLFLDSMGGTGENIYTPHFQNEIDAFELKGDKFSPKKGFFNWGKTPKYSSVEDLFKDLEK